MLEIRTTPEYQVWIDGLRDGIGKAAIAARIARLQKLGHWGDFKPIGDGIVELRVDTGPGYRVYCMRIEKALVLLLAGGSKASQRSDIRFAREIAKKWQA